MTVVAVLLEVTIDAGVKIGAAVEVDAEIAEYELAVSAAQKPVPWTSMAAAKTKTR